MNENDVILELKNVFVRYITDEDIVEAVNGIDLKITQGQSLGLVGETGAGKTTAALSAMQLLPQPAGVITGGEILFKGRNIISMGEKDKRQIRGEGISMIFQDPMTALNPTMTIGKQMMEVVEAHRHISRQEAKNVCLCFLETVGIQKNRFNDYPHQLSGGMKQRVVIAMALLCNPEVLIADEPTTALDVTIQAQVLQIIESLIAESGMSMLLITHDLGVVAQTCDSVAVMYAGEIVESGSVDDVYAFPRHPYTMGLFKSIPDLDDESELLVSIDGLPPNPAALPAGCKFHPRCSYTKEICRVEMPGLRGDGHTYKCHFDNLRGKLYE